MYHFWILITDIWSIFIFLLHGVAPLHAREGLPPCQDPCGGGHHSGPRADSNRKSNLHSNAKEAKADVHLQLQHRRRVHDRNTRLLPHSSIVPGIGDLFDLDEGLQGQSLMPALLSPPLAGTGDVGAGFKQYAFSQFPRCNCTYAHRTKSTERGDKNGTCNGTYHNSYTKEGGATGAANHHVCLFTPAKDFDWMGYSVRSDAYRYTLYVTWDGAIKKPNWNETYAQELYDHRDDDSLDFDGQISEPLNLLGNGPAAEAAHQATASALRKVLMAQFSSDF